MAMVLQAGVVEERRSEDLELSDDMISGPPPPPRSNYQSALEAPIGQPVLNSSNEVRSGEISPRVTICSPRVMIGQPVLNSSNEVRSRDGEMKR